jgi:GntR family transcriptional repressor for pyruvate dehydrogenase complex
MYEQIRSGRLYEQIVEQIEQSILSGELQAGDQFPSERELSEQFGVSRTAVREAMKVLRQKGLAESRPGRGTFVTDDTTQAVSHSLDLMFKIEKGEGLESLVEVREILEPEIAARAALRREDDDLTALEKAVSATEAGVDVDNFIASDLDFHLILAAATKNALLEALMDAMIDLLRDQRKKTFAASGGARRGIYHHRRILESISRRDPDAAREAMRAHLNQVRADSLVLPAEED